VVGGKLSRPFLLCHEGTKLHKVFLVLMYIEPAEKLICHWIPAWYNAIFYVKFKAILGIRPHSMLLYYGALHLIIVLTHSFYKYFGALHLQKSHRVAKYL
jgi:hypothetical protein